jgi:hypothetical protein
VLLPPVVAPGAPPAPAPVPALPPPAPWASARPPDKIKIAIVEHKRFIAWLLYDRPLGNGGHLARFPAKESLQKKKPHRANDGATGRDLGMGITRPVMINNELIPAVPFRVR